MCSGPSFISGGNDIETRDLSLAAGLIAGGISLRSVVGHETYSFFGFDDSAEVQETIDAFHERRLQVDAASYGEAVRSLKSAAMAARRQAATAG